MALERLRSSEMEGVKWIVGFVNNAADEMVYGVMKYSAESHAKDQWQSNLSKEIIYAYELRKKGLGINEIRDYFVKI